MATKIHFQAYSPFDAIRGEHAPQDANTSLNSNGIGQAMRLRTTEGASSLTANTTSITGPVTTPGIRADDLYWVSQPVATQVTISGTVSYSFYALESSMSANAAPGMALWKVSADGATRSLIFNHNALTESGTSATAHGGAATPNSTTLYPGDILVASPYWDDAGTMASGYTLTFYYGGAYPGVAESWIQFTETVEFNTDVPAGTRTYLLSDASDLGGAGQKNMWTGTPSGAVQYTVSSANSPSSNVWTETAGGQTLSWHTPPLQAVTLQGSFKFEPYLYSTHASASMLCRIYKTDGNGGNETQIGNGKNNYNIGLGNYTSFYGHINGTLTAGQRLKVVLSTAAGISGLETTGTTHVFTVEHGTYPAAIVWPATLTADTPTASSTGTGAVTAKATQIVNSGATGPGVGAVTATGGIVISATGDTVTQYATGNQKTGGTVLGTTAGFAAYGAGNASIIYSSPNGAVWSYIDATSNAGLGVAAVIPAGTLPANTPIDISYRHRTVPGVTGGRFLLDSAATGVRNSSTGTSDGTWRTQSWTGLTFTSVEVAADLKIVAATDTTWAGMTEVYMDDVSVTGPLGGRGAVSAAGSERIIIAGTTSPVIGTGATTAKAVYRANSETTGAGVGAVTAAALLTLRGTNTSDGVGAVSALVTQRVTAPTQAGVGSITGVGSNTAIGGTSDVTGTGATTATGRTGPVGSSSAAGVGATTAKVLVRYTGHVAGPGVGAVTAKVTQVSQDFTGPGIGVVTAAAFLIVPGVSSVAGVGAVTASPTNAIAGTSTQAGVGAVTATSTVILRSTSSAAGVGAITARATGRIDSDSTGPGVGVVTATAMVFVPGTSAVAGVGSTVATSQELWNTANDGSGMVDVSGSWFDTARAYDDNKLTYASSVTGVGTHILDITGYDFGSVVGGSDTLVEVKVNVSQYVSAPAKFNAPTVQAYDYSTPIGSAIALTERASAGDEDKTLTVTLGELRSAGFKIRYSVEQTSL